MIDVSNPRVLFHISMKEQLKIKRIQIPAICKNKKKRKEKKT
jgi:hypothetical protein